MADQPQHQQPTEDEYTEAPVTREWVDLKLAALKSELRLLIGLGIIGNQVLSHVQLPSTLGYVGSGVTAVALVAAKMWVGAR